MAFSEEDVQIMGCPLHNAARAKLSFVIFFLFGILYLDKSGNPAQNPFVAIFNNSFETPTLAQVLTKAEIDLLETAIVTFSA
jgi:hypothetical protein